MQTRRLDVMGDIMRKGWVVLVLWLAIAAFPGCSNRVGKDAPDVVDAGVEALDAPDVVSCLDGLVLWEEYNVCAPRVDKCENPWKLPLIGGGCVAIGPRACPKGWDPEADVDCEPGELMDYAGSVCPEGFVLTEDEAACIPFFQENCGEMEIPVLGGGCKVVGPKIGQTTTERPAAGTCDTWEIPLAGGGCFMPGPRTCPKAWDQDSGTDCQVGDVLPCATGWDESEDGLYCKPGLDECDQGEAPIFGGGCKRIVPLDQDCPDGLYAEPPEGAIDVAHVSAESVCGQECGTRQLPFQSIQTAMNSLPEGGTVLVGPGVYPEGLVITKPVIVRGICASRVTVSGAEPVLDRDLSKFGHAGVIITGTSGVEVSGLSVMTANAGIIIDDATDVLLADLELAGSVGVAFYIGDESSATASRMWIHDTAGGKGPGLDGIGLWVEGGAKLSIEESLCESARGAAAYVTGADTQLVADGIALRGTESNQSGFGGYGVRAKSNAKVHLDRTLLIGNRTAGIIASLNARTQVSGSVIRGTQASPSSSAGVGLSVSNGGEISISGSHIDLCTGSSVAATDSGSTVKLTGTVVRSTAQTAKGKFGHGIEAVQGAVVTLQGCLLDDSTEVGLFALDVGTEVHLNATVVRRTIPVSGGDLGIGINAGGGSLLAADACLVAENTTVGIAVHQVGTTATIKNSLIRDTVPGEEFGMGFGGQTGTGAALSLENTVLDGNVSSGLVASGAGTKLVVVRSVIRNTLSSPKKEAGYGIQAGDGCTVSVSDTVLDGNTRAGVISADPLTTVSMVRSNVRGTWPGEVSPGGASANGCGVQIEDGARMSMSGCLLEENSTSGMLLLGQATQGDVDTSMIRNNGLPAGPSSSGGVVVASSAGLTLDLSAIDGNGFAGVVAVGSSTQITLSRSEVGGNLPDPESGIGIGIGAANGSFLSLSGCLVQDNSVLAVIAGDPETTTIIRGTIIRDTAPGKKGDEQRFGFGLSAYDGVYLELLASMLTGNTSAGLAIGGAGTYVKVSQVGISGTHSGGMSIGKGPEREFQVFGDGLFVDQGAFVELDQAVLWENERCGVYFVKASGAINGTLVSGNKSFGMALEKCAQSVDYGDPGNFFIGNSLALPPAQSAEVTHSPEGLPPPPPPPMAFDD